MRWLFAYGSLMWDPCFDYAEEEQATLHGYHRAFNKASYRWGTEEQPAPALGLADGGQCEGVAFGITAGQWEAARASVREREGDAYTLEQLPVSLSDGRAVEALVAVNSHERDYLGDRPVEERAQIAVDATGPAGTGHEYVLRTARKLAAHGIDDPHVQEMADEVTARLPD